MFRHRRYPEDRFIPRRAGINVETLNYMLLKDKSISSTESESPTRDNKRFSNRAYVKWQQRMFRERIWSNIKIPKKILNFSEPYQSDDRSNLNQMWPVYPRSKPLLGSPSVVLDMPSLEGNIYNNCTDWSSSGYLASVFAGEVFLWHPENHNSKSVTNTGGTVSKCVSWSKNEPVFAMAMLENLVSVFDCKQNKIIQELTCPCRTVCTISAIEWTNRNALIIGCSDGHVTVFNTKSKMVNVLYRAHNGIIIKIALSSSEKYLATSGADCNVRVWLWPSLKEHFQVTYTSPVRGIAWHPWKHSFLAIGGGYGRGCLSIWNATNYTRLGYKSPSDNGAISVDGLTFNPLSGELVVSYWLEKNGVEKNAIVVLSNLNTEVDAIEWHTGRVLFLLWGNNGTTLATAGADENLCMWEFLGSSFTTKKLKNNRNKRKIVNDICDTAKIFGHCIR